MPDGMSIVLTGLECGYHVTLRGLARVEGGTQ